jgi:Cellulase (glycosyl hydrolase family 5)
MARFIGYGAYNLCFDRDLAPYQGKDFFQFLREGGWPVNHVKVICYRKATQEGLPEGNARTIPLYAPGGAVNPAFLNNLQKLVQRARLFGFTVQICLFHYHAVAATEFPEYRPSDLVQPAALNRCQYMQYFFAASPGSAVFAAQAKMVNAIVNHLRFTNNLSNVIWEVANELRVQQCGSLAANRAANCSIVNWMNNIAQTIRQAAVNATVITSTGAHSMNVIPRPPEGAPNEAITFSQRRPADGCAAPPFTPSPALYDLHAGQWHANQPDLWPSMLQSGLRNRFQLGYNIATPKFIINTDGLDESERTPAAIEAWAREAFRNGHHFTTKQWYPPHEPAYDIPVLDALKRAAVAFPG